MIGDFNKSCCSGEMGIEVWLGIFVEDILEEEVEMLVFNDISKVFVLKDGIEME